MGVQSDMEIIQMVGIQRKYLDTLMISLQECHVAWLQMLQTVNTQQRKLFLQNIEKYIVLSSIMNYSICSIWTRWLQDTTTWTLFSNAFQYCFDPRSTDTARKETFSHRKLPWTTWLQKSKLSQAGRKQQNNTMTILVCGLCHSLLQSLQESTCLYLFISCYVYTTFLDAYDWLDWLLLWSSPFCCIREALKGDASKIRWIWFTGRCGMCPFVVCTPWIAQSIRWDSVGHWKTSRKTELKAFWVSVQLGTKLVTRTT